MEFLVLIVLMVAMFWFMSRSARKQRERMAEKQKNAAVPGTWVVTIGGFLGKVVSVDGDVVTLESPSGVETIWQVAAIREAHVPNFGTAAEDEAFDDDAIVRDESVVREDPATGGVTDHRRARRTDGTANPGGVDGDPDFPIDPDTRR